MRFLFRRSIHVRLAVASATALAAVALVAFGFGGTSNAIGVHQPDALLKLCGASNTCVIQPWHPWVGGDVYSGSGKGEKVLGAVEEGNMIRFWVMVENDGSASQTIRVKGCKGTGTFPVKAVNVGAYRAFTNAGNITKAFKAGTAKFSFPPSSGGKTVIITVTFLANTTTRGATYSCPITVISTAQSTAKDTVVAKMITI